MAVYFIPKTRFIAKATNIRPATSKWTPRWSIGIRRSIGSTAKGSATTGVGAGTGGNNSNTSGGDTGSSSGNSSNSTREKGKLYARKWSWKAGAGWTILSVLDWWLLAAGGWLSWQGVFLRWTPIGFCMFAAIQWHYQNKKEEQKNLCRIASKWQTNVYCSLPLRVVSRCWGWLADCRMPIILRPMVYGLYSTTFGVNIDEAASSDFKNYRSLAEFFARSLKKEARFIDPKSCIVSPADGKVLHFGPATSSVIEQVKGVSYSIESFLGPSNWIADKDGSPFIQKIKHYSDQETTLYQCIIYLAPGDYHRFHSPAAWQPMLRRHFAGELLSVSPKIAHWLPGLFCLNERALYMGTWKYGFFSFTAVGATNVGSVQIYFDDGLKTNQWRGWNLVGSRGTEFDELKLPPNTQLGKGELLGQFNMGSTVVLIFEAPHNFNFNIEPGQTIRVGQKIGCLDEKL